MTVLLSIDRTSLSLSALELSGVDDARTLGIQRLVVPGAVPRITYAPDNPDIHGSLPLGWSYQEGLIQFDAIPKADDELEVQTLMATLRAALGRLTYPLTSTIGNALPETWDARVGTIAPTERTYVNLNHHCPIFAVTIPVYPVPA